MIGSKIKARRKELNLTQEELASMTGYTTRSTINKIEQEINDIPLSKVSVLQRLSTYHPHISWVGKMNIILI